VTSKLELLEEKIHKVVDELLRLRRDNERLTTECETLKSQIALTTTESRKASRLLSEYDHMKRSHEQAVGRVERALQKLNTLRLQ
jgi:hypothetical protein